MALTKIQQVRLEVGDIDVSLPILSDVEYAYFLTKHGDSVSRAAIDSAKTILFKLSTRVRERVELFEIHGQQAAVNYVQALKMYLNNPQLNPVLQNTSLYAGGVSLSDMSSNDSNPDNNIVSSSGENREIPARDLFSF